MYYFQPISDDRFAKKAVNATDTRRSTNEETILYFYQRNWVQKSLCYREGGYIAIFSINFSRLKKNAKG